MVRRQECYGRDRQKRILARTELWCPFNITNNIFSDGASSAEDTSGLHLARTEHWCSFNATNNIFSEGASSAEDTSGLRASTCFILRVPLLKNAPRAPRVLPAFIPRVGFQTLMPNTFTGFLKCRVVLFEGLRVHEPVKALSVKANSTALDVLLGVSWWLIPV